MGKYLKLFETHSQYESYTADTQNFITPNVSYCLDTTNEVHYSPYVEPPETRVVAKFNVTNTSSPTKIASAITTFSKIEIDGVEQPSVTTGYTFSTIGEHTVKYTLKDPTSIGDEAFDSCYSLTSIVIPNSVTSIAQQAFSNCISLTSIVIPDSVTSIGVYAFEACRNLTSIIIPDSVTTIGSNAFKSCTSLTSCTIGSGVTSIGYQVFYQCSGLTTCTIGSGVTSIGNGAFHYCSGLTSITIPDSVTSIGEHAFGDCISLTSCTIGSGVTSIGVSAFYYCINLVNITCNAMTAPTISNNSFRNVKTDGTLYVPIGSSGYDVWMETGSYYLGMYNWTKVEQ